MNKKLKQIGTMILNGLILTIFLLCIVFKQWVGVWVMVGLQVLMAGWILYSRRKQYFEVVNMGAMMLLKRRNDKLERKKNQSKGKCNDDCHDSKVCDSNLQGLQTKDSIKDTASRNSGSN